MFSHFWTLRFFLKKIPVESTGRHTTVDLTMMILRKIATTTLSPNQPHNIVADTQTVPTICRLLLNDRI